MKKQQKQNRTIKGLKWVFTESEKAFPRAFKYGKHLCECYARPSREKERIFNQCQEETLELSNNLKMSIDWIFTGVKSFNTCIFTYQAKMEDDKRTIYILITPSYNYYYELEKF